MRVKEAIEEAELGISKPDNVSEESWQKAVDLYKAAKASGDPYPELTVAQAALETGWFKSPSGKYNYFGQKASASQPGTVHNTKEVSNGEFYNTTSKFRDYQNLDESLADRNEKWVSKYKDAETVEEAISRIWRYDPEKKQGVGYATDSNYGKKLKTVLGMMDVNLSETPEYYDNPQNIAGSTQYAGADIKVPEYEPTPNYTPTNTTQIDNTEVANPYKDIYQELLKQNTILTERLNQQEEADKASQKAQAAQQKLNEKAAQKAFLQDLILKSGAQFIERTKRQQEPLNLPPANSPGYPSFQDGGVKYGSKEYEQAYNDGTFADAINTLDEVVITADKKTGENILKDYPYYNTLTKQELEYWNDNSPIGVAVRRKARTNKGLAEDAANIPSQLLQGAMSAVQMPQSAMVEGVEALRGEEYNFNNVIPGNSQRVPSDVWGYENPQGFLQNAANMGMDIVADPLNVSGAGLIAKGNKARNLLKVGRHADDIVFYHGGLDPKSTIDDIDPFKLAARQNKKGRDYAGFYMSDNVDEGSFALQYHRSKPGSGLHEVRLPSNSKAYEHTGSMED